MKPLTTAGRPLTIAGRGRLALYCSPKCKRRFVRAATALRSALARGAALETFHLVDPIVVFQLQKYRCQGCGTRCNPDLIGTNDLNAPTLDHVIPAIEGGTHTWDNVQTLCRLCNNRKSGAIVDFEAREAA